MALRPHVLRLNSKYLAVLAVLGFLVPIGAYFWLIERYGVNTIYSDQWADIPLIGLSRAGHLDLSALWAQHDENRIFFSNVLVLLLAQTTSFNIHIEMYLSALLLVAAVVLFAFGHRSWAQSRHWVYYCPVAILMLSFVQFQNTLWGFQVAWYLVMISLAAALFLLDRPTLTGLTLMLAMTAAVVGSFSSIQGLLIWLAGLVVLLHHRRPMAYWLAWIAAAIATSVVYFFNLNLNVGFPQHGYALHHPIASIKFLLFALGDVLGVRTGYTSNYAGIELVGAVILVAAVAALITSGFRRDGTTSSAIGMALMVFGISFALFITESRITLGETEIGAGSSRYTTFDLLVLVGTYLTLLGRTSARRTEALQGGSWKRRSIQVIWTTLVVAMGIQVIFGVANGISGSSANYRSQVLAADVTVNAAKATDV